METKNGTWFKNHSHAWIIILLASAPAIVAFYSWFTLPAYPVAQLAIFTLLLLLSVNLFIGNILAKGSQSRDNLVLPFVELVKGGTGTVPDAGCGSGRTTISLGKAASELKIVGFDHLGDNRLQALRETWRVLKPGGRCSPGATSGWSMKAISISAHIS